MNVGGQTGKRVPMKGRTLEELRSFYSENEKRCRF
jgi:hypothetical protein